MQLLPMASSPDGLISARYAVITKTPGSWRRGGFPPTHTNLGLALHRHPHNLKAPVPSHPSVPQQSKGLELLRTTNG